MSSEVFHETAGAFEIVGLRSAALEVAVAPRAGAKLVRLLDRRYDREWTWAPDAGRRLFENAVGDAFDDSPLVGVDECIPTVAPCVVEGQPWPDHGEVWARAWELDAGELNAGRITTTIALKTAPLVLRRTATVTDNRLRLDYVLSSRGEQQQRFAWCWHPLFAVREGDRIELPAGEYRGRVDSAANLPGLATDQVVSWPTPAPGVRADTMLAGSVGTSLKLYLPSPAEGVFAVRNERDGTTMRGTYGPVEALPYLGIWATRSGWNGFHHFAIEPTNVMDDHADRIDAGNRAAFIAPGEARRWFVELELGS